jgi:hypothetical protein
MGLISAGVLLIYWVHTHAELTHPPEAMSSAVSRTNPAID